MTMGGLAHAVNTLENSELQASRQANAIKAFKAMACGY